MDAVLFVRLEISGGDQYLFTQPTEQLDATAIPSLEGVSVSAAVLDPGRSIGQRETVTARFTDHLYSFDTDAYDAGTFWTKFRARYPSIQGSTLRVYRGDRGLDLADLERRTYIVDKLQINRNGATISAKDPLALVLGKAAQAPSASTGELSAAIDDNDLAITLVPAGVGNLEYPASGRACIGGSEIVSFTRTGDAVTLSTRGENLGSVGEDHEAGAKFQLVLSYTAASPSAIVNGLLTNYTDVDPTWITVSDWTAVDDHVGHLYDARIAAPESVTALLDELSEQIGMTLYWDAVAEKLRLISLAPTGSGFVVNTDNIIEGTFDVTEQPDKRISEPWTYYAQRDQVEELDTEANYQRIAVSVADNFADYVQRAIKIVHSRWISIANQVAANRLNDMLIARYKVPPRTFKFSLFRSGVDLPRLGAGVTVSHWQLVDEDGVEVSVAAQIISESGDEDRVDYEAEEVNYDGSAETSKFVVIDSDTTNISLRALFDSLYSSVGASDVVTFVVQSGAQVIGYPEFGYAVDVGTWPGGVTLNLTINGSVVGASGSFDFPGSPDPIVVPGLAITTARAINIENNGSINGQAGGIAINGYSFVTYTGPGTIAGSLV